MPYDCTDMKNLHCSPLKLYDYFMSGPASCLDSHPCRFGIQGFDLFGSNLQRVVRCRGSSTARTCGQPEAPTPDGSGPGALDQAQGQRLEEVLKLLKSSQGEDAVISLGINYSEMHDSSACIARNGEVLFAAAEERFSRLKHDARFPELAIRACLDFAEVQPRNSIMSVSGGRRHRRLSATTLNAWPSALYPGTMGTS